MTTEKDFARQASLFTMNGLTDPRMFPQYSIAKKKSITSGPDNTAMNPALAKVRKFAMRLADLIIPEKTPIQESK